VNVDDVETDDTSISFGLLITDLEDVGSVTSITLYEDQLLIDTITDFNGDYAFTGLTPYTSYRIVVTYTYNFGDSLGDQVLTLTYEFKTTPSLVLESVELLNANANAILIKDTILIRLNVENPSEVTITQVQVNGVWYAFTVTNNESGRISIVASETIGNGSTVLTIEAIRFVIDDTTFTMAQDLSKTITVFINGEILVNSVEIVDPQFALIYYSLTNQTITVILELDNGPMYDVTEVVYSGSISGTISAANITMAEDKQSLWFNVQTPRSSNSLYIKIDSIKYSNETLATRTKRFATLFDTLTLIYDENPIDIATVDDLRNIVNTKGYTHRLVNDIDLKGIDWQPLASFFGILDGNGFAIKNMSIVTVYEEESPSVGLFTYISSAYIKNLSITNATIIVTYKSELGNNIYSYVGTLAGQIGDYTRLENLNISSDILVISDSPSSGWESHYLGGVAGYAGSYNTYVDITANVVLAQEGKYHMYQGGIMGRQAGSYSNFDNINVVMNGTIKSLNNYNSAIGGVVGYSEGQAITYRNLTSDGKLTVIAGSSYMGGLIGEMRRGGKITQSSSKMTLNNLNNTAGGLVGLLSASTIENSSFEGKIENGSSNTGGIAGYAVDQSKIINVNFTGLVMSESNNSGGIVGYANDLTAIGLVSNGTVNGNYNVGGLFGEIYNSKIEKSINQSLVVTLNINAGSISGYSINTKYSQIIADGIVQGTVNAGRYNFGGVVGVGYNNLIENSIVLAEFKNNSTATGGFFGDDQGGNKVLNSYVNIVIENLEGNVGLLVGSTNTNLIIENTFAVSQSEIKLYGNRNSLEGENNVFSTYDTSIANILNILNNATDPLWDNNVWSFDTEYPTLIALA
jgi:hypothetical protein